MKRLIHEVLCNHKLKIVNRTVGRLKPRHSKTINIYRRSMIFAFLFLSNNPKGTRAWGSSVIANLLKNRIVRHFSYSLTPIVIVWLGFP